MITTGRAKAGRGLRRARRTAPRRDPRRDQPLDWLFSTHTTSRSAAELLLFLHGGMMVNKGGMRSTVKAGRSA